MTNRVRFAQLLEWDPTFSNSYSSIIIITIICRWSAIAAQLPGRTDNEIKNHWHTNLKKRVKQKSVTEEAKQAASDDDGLSPREGTQEGDTKTQDNPPNPATPPIIESPTSPQASTSDFSTTDVTALPCTDLISDDDFAFLEAYQAPSGNFWTEPFLSDSYYLPSEEILTPRMDLIDYPFLDGELSYPYSFINMDDLITMED